MTPTQVADITIHPIVEMTQGFSPALDFFPTLSPEILAEHRHWLAPDALDATDRIVLCFQSFLVRTPHHTILVDTCIGNDKDVPHRPAWHRKQDRIWLDALAQAGATPDDIDLVLCTHLHADHIGWNTRLENGVWVPTFPNARYLFSETELAHWTARNAETPIGAIQDSVLPIVAANRADLVTSHHEIGDHVRLLPTPGHTIDHFAVELGHGAAHAVITGDLIHSPLQARYPHLNMWLDHDPAQAAATRRAFLDRFCDTATQCCFAHFPNPSTRRVKRWADGFRCDPA